MERLEYVILQIDLAGRIILRRSLDVRERRRISRGRRCSKISNNMSKGIFGSSCSFPGRDLQVVVDLNLVALDSVVFRRFWRG